MHGDGGEPKQESSVLQCGNLLVLNNIPELYISIRLANGGESMLGLHEAKQIPRIIKLQAFSVWLKKKQTYYLF